MTQGLKMNLAQKIESQKTGENLNPDDIESLHQPWYLKPALSRTFQLDVSMSPLFE